MLDAGIFAEDVLIVDRSLPARHGDVVVAAVRGELTVKELHLKPPPARLISRNNRYPDVDLADGEGLELFGVVSSVVRQLRKG